MAEDQARRSAGKERISRAGTARSLPRPPRQPASPLPSFDVDIERRRALAAACAFNADPVAAHGYLGDPEPLVRGAALSALVRLRVTTAADREAAVGDPAAVVRRTLAELALPAGVTSCRVLLDDEDAGVVEAACFATGEITDVSSVERLAQIAEGHSDPLCRESAVAALGVLGAPEGLGAVLQALTDRPEIRRRAVIALSSYDTPEMTAALTRALEDRDWQVRQAAEDVLSISEREPN